jgi:glycerol uptake facilitator-like aquaporin
MPGYPIGKAIVIEAVATFFLMLAVFGTALDDRRPSSKMAGPTIGLTVAFDVLAFGSFTGAAMNPARWFGPALVAGTLDNWYVWVVGPVAGAIIAAVLYLVVFVRGVEPATP